MLRTISYAIILLILTTGLFFKFMHWPGAREMLMAALIGITIGVIEYAIGMRKEKVTVKDILYPLVGLLFGLGILFLLAEWPYGLEILVFGMLGLAIGFIEYAYSIRTSILATLPLLFAIATFAAIFKLVHWPFIPYVLTSAIVTSGILVPVLLFIKGNQLKSSSPIVSGHLFTICALWLISALLDIVPMINIDIMDRGLAKLASVLITIVLVVFIRNAIKEEELSSNHKIIHGLLQCLVVICVASLLFEIIKV